MSTKPLPPAPNLEYYRKQAKALLRSVQTADPDAIIEKVRRGKQALESIH